MNVNKENSNLVRLGDYIEPSDERNRDLKITLSQGISNKKYFQSPKQVAENSNADKIVRRGQFAYNKATTRNGEKISIAYREGEDCTVSSAYQIFRITNENKLNPHFLWLFFCRAEFDRYVRYMSQGSAHEFFEFGEMSRIQIPLPSIEIQQEVIDTYYGLRELAEQNEALIKPLTEACQAYIVDCKKKYPLVELGGYIDIYHEKNSDCEITLEQGINIEKVFITPQRSNSDLSSRVIVRNGQFAYCTQLNNENVAIAYRKDKDCVVSPVYNSFEIKQHLKNVLMHEYLFLWLKRKEFGRYVYWKSIGSAYEFLREENLCEYKIPIPSIEVQQAIVNLFNCAEEAKNIANDAREKMKNLSPALVQRAING